MICLEKPANRKIFGEDERVEWIFWVNDTRVNKILEKNKTIIIIIVIVIIIIIITIIIIIIIIIIIYNNNK